MMNKLLQRQLQKHLGKADIPENFTKLLNVISESYDHYEKDRRLIERSIELSSKEMIELNNQVKKSGKAELQKVYNQMQMVFENIEEILYSVDVASLKIIQISAVCEKVYGYTPSEFMADRDLWQKVILSEDIDIVHQHFKNLYDGKSIVGQYRILHKDKSIRWLESKIIPTMDEAGQLIRLDGVTIDISERKRVEKELEESVSILEATLESTADGILVVDLNARVVRINNKFIELWRLPQEILSAGDDEKRIAFASAQLINPEGFISKIKELNAQYDEMSFDILEFKDGRTFERYSQPQLINGKYVGRVWSFRDITDRKIADDKIKESELRYRSLIEQATDAICIADSSMKFMDMNPSGCRMLGYTKEEFLKLSVADLFIAEDVKANPFKLDKLKSGEAIRNERRFIRKDGTLLDVEVNGKVLEDGRFIVFGRDITERKQAEKLIKESEFRYRSLIEQATDAICIADSSMRFMDINPSGSQLLGYSKEEFLLLSVSDILPAEDLKTNPFKIDELKLGKTIRNERKAIKKDGTIAEVEVSGKILEDGRFIVFARDISERKQTEKQLQESEMRYRNLIEQATDAICITDTAMKFIDVNQYGCEILGYSKEEALQLSVIDLLFTEDLASNPFKFDNVEPGEIIRNERRLKRKDGVSVIMEVSTRRTEDGRFIIFGHDISERKKSEKNLKESEKRLRQIIDLVPHFIFAKDARGKFVLANEAVARAYGCTVEDLIGKTDADFNSQKEEVEHFMQEDLKVINSGNVKYNVEETITDATGNIRVLSTTKIPYTSPGHDTPGVLGVSVDISERKKAETVLKESEGQLSVASQIAKLGYWEFDVAKNLFKFNDQFYSIFKTTVEEVGGYDVSSEEYLRLFVHPDDSLIVINAAAAAIKSPDPNYNHQIEYRIKYADGDTGYMTARFYTIKNESGRTVKTFGAIQDITEKKNAEAALIKREGQLTIATQIAKLGYWEFDVVNGLFTFNDQFYAIFKTTREEVGGYTMAPGHYSELFVYPDDRSVVGMEVANAINSPDPHFSRTIEHRITYANGEMGWISVHFYIVKNAAGQTIKTFGVNQDITERKKGEETLLRSEANLELKNNELELKNKELEQFAYVASHDLQEPLRTTSSFAELLQQQYKGRLDDNADQYLTFITQSSDRMKVLIKDLLDYSRIGRKKEWQLVDCNIMLQEVLADLDAAIKETGAEITAGPLPVIRGYPTEIKQLFQNLVINAVKFRKPNTSPQIDISAHKNHGPWEFVCRDNGIGIQEQHKERIFVIFQRLHTRNEYEGSGIGLAHCKKIVELHGGKIWIESSEGEGAAFHFTIPKNNN